MINESSAKKFCKDDISKIENYDKAINDQTETWICHHRLGLVHSSKELERLGLYENRPADELIFLTHSEHSRLHGLHMSDETKRKMSEAKKGKPHSAEHVRKIAESNKGQTRSDETRQKISAAKKGKSRKPFSDEHRRKMSEARKAYWARRKAFA